jgi:hypothetical protein
MDVTVDWSRCEGSMSKISVVCNLWVQGEIKLVFMCPSLLLCRWRGIIQSRISFVIVLVLL